MLNNENVWSSDRILPFDFGAACPGRLSKTCLRPSLGVENSRKAFQCAKGISSYNSLVYELSQTLPHAVIEVVRRVQVSGKSYIQRKGNILILAPLYSCYRRYKETLVSVSNRMNCNIFHLTEVLKNI
jgi:hypothetical protein